ncbi:glutamate synthase domain 2 [Candidatus Scalindua japonica]|uniref:Glutamate synthase domain 2 n=1 Tax=Candidatus Scalindua japonica TaxID=1284222 RepID=A0A286TYA0_9BACT|nr:glutamate synthase domain 2 [Candidatus Scalindua japonica]
MGNNTYTDAHGKSPATISSKHNELGDIKIFHSLELDFRLVGTIIAGEENSYAVIMDETTSKQGTYKLGESINEATVLKIDKESITVEKDGTAQVLRITGGSYTEAASSELLSGDVPPSIGVSKDLPYFEPVFSMTGPPVDENIAVEELPYFEPITNNTGPSFDDEEIYEDLPGFEPFVSYAELPE